MEAAERENIEREIRTRFDARDLHGAATVGIRGFGPEIFGVLLSLHRDETRAAEVFSDFTERLWRGLDGFAWPLPTGSGLEAIAELVRTETHSYLRTHVKDGFTRLREALPADDQLLLVLRVDKAMTWNDIARVLNESEEALDVALEKREAARLRQRYQTLKRELLERARAAGLA